MHPPGTSPVDHHVHVRDAEALIEGNAPDPKK
jgi:hypothetical protein